MGLADVWDNKMTCAFVLGHGDLLHNNRELASGGFRKRGDKRRRDWNVYSKGSLDDMFNDLFGEALARYNAELIRKGRKSRCKTMKGWIDAQLRKRASRGAKVNSYGEFLIRIGDMVSACPYVYKTDAEGRQVDEKGKPVERWETDKRPVPVLDANGKPIKSVRYHKLVKALETAIGRFQSYYPELHVFNWAIHCDEYGMHAHVNFVACHNARDGIGLGFAPTTAYKNICDRLGLEYKDTRNDCAEKAFCNHARNKLIEMMPELGLEWVDGQQAGRKKLSVDEYSDYADYRTASLRKDRETNRRTEAVLKERERKLRVAEQKVAEHREAARKDAESARALRDSYIEKVNDADRLRQAVEKSKTEVQTERKRLKEQVTLFADSKKKATELLRKQNAINSSLWLLEAIKKEHPEWVKEKEQQYFVRERKRLELVDDGIQESRRMQNGK